MNKFIIAVAFFALFIPAVSHAHGGGCRKDAPAGMCCHVDHSTGIMHCH